MSGTIAVDTETKGLSWWDPNEQAFLATWADADGEYDADLSVEEEVAEFRAALDDADTILCHNLSFDVNQIRETIGYDIIAEGKVTHDTDLMSRVLFPEGQGVGSRGGHGLKNLAKVFLRSDAGDTEDAIKEMGKQIGLRTIKQTGAYYDIYRAYPDVMTDYARMDVRLTYDLWEKFNQAMAAPLDRVYDLERQVAPILIRAEQRGIKTDQAAVARLKAQYTSEMQALEDSLVETLGADAVKGEGSEQAMIDALLAAGVPLKETTDTGQLKTNKYVLQNFEKDFPFLADLEEYRRLRKFLAQYIGSTEGIDVLHTSFRQCGAWTGRMSSTRPNMQNLPKRAGKEVRSIFVPREGYSFVVRDYESIEVRLLAYYLNDESFQRMIEEGHDAHAWMATNIWGGSISDYEKGSDGEFKRGLAKSVLFAITYGAGAPRVASMLQDADMPATRDDAKAIISKIKVSLPNYYKLNKRIRDKIEREGHVNTLFGRKQIVNKDKAYVGLNALVQGSAADCMKQGLINVDKVLGPFDAYPLLVVHDELVVECRTEDAEECSRLIDEAMVAALPAGVHPRLSTSGSVVHTNYADA